MEEAAAERAAEAKRAAEEAERDKRERLINKMQKSITKDARADADDGMLGGPIYDTSCAPLGLRKPATSTPCSDLRGDVLRP